MIKLAEMAVGDAWKNIRVKIYRELVAAGDDEQDQRDRATL